MDASLSKSLPLWATLMKDAYIKDNFVHGTVSDENGLQPAHNRATLSDHIKR